MSTVEQIVKNESVEDVLTVFALGSATPTLDRMFARYRYEVAASGELLQNICEIFRKRCIGRPPRACCNQRAKLESSKIHDRKQIFLKNWAINPKIDGPFT